MEESQKKQAWISSLRLLAASPKTRAELALKLLKKGFPDSVVQETLNRLENHGVLSDKAYALNLLNRFVQGQPSGRRRIDFELKRRRIPGRIREAVLSQITPAEERERAREVGRNRWGRLAKLGREKRMKRVYDFLIRRGFDFQLARDLVEEFAQEGSHA